MSGIGRRPRTMTALWVTLTILLTIYGQVILRWQLRDATLPTDINGLTLTALGWILTNPWVASGVFAMMMVIPAWMLVLRRLEVSFAFPFLGLAQAGVVVLGICLLGEAIDPLRILGVVLICIGVSLLGWDRS